MGWGVVDIIFSWLKEIPDHRSRTGGTQHCCDEAKRRLFAALRMTGMTRQQYRLIKPKPRLVENEVFGGGAERGHVGLVAGFCIGADDGLRAG